VASEAQREAVRRYAQKTTQFVFRMRDGKDDDVTEQLMKQPNRSAYIRQLIRNDIRNSAR
jgi:hypothetical protein